jgi:CheY-like chemotaxis protein
MKKSLDETNPEYDHSKGTTGQRRILCIDPNQDVCEMVATLLGYAGYGVTYAMSVAEGLHLARSARFDLILLDSFFYDGTGLELCGTIRTFDTDTPILFYSAVAYETEMRKAMSAGAQGYIVKPLGTLDLVQTVSHFVTRGEPM